MGVNYREYAQVTKLNGDDEEFTVDLKFINGHERSACPIYELGPLRYKRGKVKIEDSSYIVHFDDGTKVEHQINKTLEIVDLRNNSDIAGEASKILGNAVIKSYE